MFSRFWERWDGIHFVYCQLWKYLGSFSSADKLELIRCKPGILGEKFKNGWTRKSRNRRDEKHSLGKERDQNPSYGIRPLGGPLSPLTSDYWLENIMNQMKQQRQTRNYYWSLCGSSGAWQSKDLKQNDVTWYQTQGPLLPWQRRERYLNMSKSYRLW